MDKTIEQTAKIKVLTELQDEAEKNLAKCKETLNKSESEIETSVAVNMIYFWRHAQLWIKSKIDGK